MNPPRMIENLNRFGAQQLQQAIQVLEELEKYDLKDNVVLVWDSLDDTVFLRGIDNYYALNDDNKLCIERFNCLGNSYLDPLNYTLWAIPNMTKDEMIAFKKACQTIFDIKGSTWIMPNATKPLKCDKVYDLVSYNDAKLAGYNLDPQRVAQVAEAIDKYATKEICEDTPDFDDYADIAETLYGISDADLPMYKIVDLATDLAQLAADNLTTAKCRRDA